MRARFHSFVMAFVVALVTATVLLAANRGHAQAAPVSTVETLGIVQFPTSCDVEVQPQFNRAVALMHSFQFANAIEAFKGILATDPQCSMAYWGIALSDWGNPFAVGRKSPSQMEQGLTAVSRGREIARTT